MSGSNEQVINIRANAKKNGITTLFLGVGILLCSFLWLAFMPRSLNLPGFFLISASIVTLLIGWFKIREPEHSLRLSPANIEYMHRLGSWRLAWHNIQRIDQPRILRGIEHQPLEMVGFKIKDYDSFIQNISPRLATHILMEQRPLLLQSSDPSCTTGMCAGNDFLEETKYKLPSGKILNGVQAMLANRMNNLRNRLGFDIYLACTELDREPQDFIRLLRDCQNSGLVKKESDEAQ